MGHVWGVPGQEAHATAVPTDGHVLTGPRAGVGGGRQAVAEPQVVARCVGTAADDKPGGEGRKGN